MRYPFVLQPIGKAGLGSMKFFWSVSQCPDSLVPFSRITTAASVQRIVSVHKILMDDKCGG